MTKMAPLSLPLLILCGPLAIAGLILALPSRRVSPKCFEWAHLASITAVLVLTIMIAGRVLASGPILAFAGWFYVDALGAIFVTIIGVIGVLAGFHSLGYVRHDLESGTIDRPRLKVYYGFFSLFLFTMLLAATSNNIVMMWVAIEATTLGSAFLVGLYGRRSSLEAAWKYMVVCTVGVAFGLYGTVLAYANGSTSLGNAEDAILWTTLVSHAGSLDPLLAKLSFVFILIGFGTKAGLFPMHAWLPDAHSEAPSPVSALLSGVLLKCALLAIIRSYAITARTVGPEFPQSLILILGALSIVVASLLFFIQQDLKRKLAYSSIEHIGVMALGLGVGGPLGVGAALLHAINHSLVKALLFLGTGNVLMKYGTRDLDAVKGLLRVAPASGLMMMFGALALAGFPPFNIFVSEFLVFVAGLKAGYFWLIVVCALSATVTVAGLIQMIAKSVLGRKPDAMPQGDVGWRVLLPMAVLSVLILLTGMTILRPVSQLVQSATAIVIDSQAPVALAVPWQPTASAEPRANDRTAPSAIVAGLASHTETHP